MAKLSSINKNNKRIKLSEKLYKKRLKLKKIIMDKKISLEERFKAQQKLSKLWQIFYHFRTFEPHNTWPWPYQEWGSAKVGLGLWVGSIL